MVRLRVAGAVLVSAVAGCGGGGERAVVLRADRSLSHAELARSAEVVRERLEAHGRDATVRARGARELVVRLDGDIAGDVTRADDVRFYDLELALGPQIRFVRHGNVSCGPPQPLCPGTPPNPDHAYRYVFHARPLANAAVVRSARATQDPQTGAPVVVLDLTPTGRAVVHAATKLLAQRGPRFGGPQHLAIVVDGRLLSWPSIDFRAYPNGIDVRSGLQITGVDEDEADEIAKELEHGGLPAEFREVKG